jgi:hypothetical protein
MAQCLYLWFWAVTRQQCLWQLEIMSTGLYTCQLGMFNIMCGVAIAMLLHRLLFWQYHMVSIINIVSVVKLMGFSLT